MTNGKEIFIQRLFLIGIPIISLGAFMIWGIPAVVVIPLSILQIAYLVWRGRLRNKKRVGEFLAKDFSEMNYTILSERPLTFREQYENYDYFDDKLAYGFGRFTNAIKRRFVVRNEKGHDFELIVSIIQTGNDKFKYRIDSKSRIRD